jgi:hypothetical protein
MSYLTQILLKQGVTNPGTVLELAEPAYDTSANLLYVGNGIGNAATLIGPVAGGDVTKEYVDGSLGALSGIYTTFEYVDGSLAAIPVADVTKEYVDGSLGTKAVTTILIDNSIFLSSDGNDNIFIGGGAGFDEFGMLTGCTTSIYLGFHAMASEGGNADNEIVIGDNALGHGAETTTIGKSSTQRTYLYGELFINDASLSTTLASKENVPTYQFISSDFNIPAPSGSHNIYTIKNIGSVDISIYTDYATYQIDARSDKLLLPMNTMDVYDFDTTNWYII